MIAPAPKAHRAKSPSTTVLELDYSLAELPSAQHRAGLAGLVMMVLWLDRTPAPKKGTCKLIRLDETGATLAIDREGLRGLFDETYAASMEEVQTRQLWKDKDKEVKPPSRTEEIEVRDAKGRPKKEKVYYYEEVVPKAGLLCDVEPPAPDGKTPWVKLWREMLWGTLRGVPTTRVPFKERASLSPSTDWESAWAELVRPSDEGVDLPSTYYIGAQATTAENVPFKDRARQRLLLHFWPYVAQVYVPRILSTTDGKAVPVGYAIAVPDVIALDTFCKELRSALKDREADVAGYRPKQALIDHPAESALDLSRRLRSHIAVEESDRRTGDLVLGFEVYHLKKEGKSVRILSTARVEPVREQIDAYVRLRAMGLWNLAFRRTRLVNLLDGRRWETGFDRLIETSSQIKLTIGSTTLCHDARISFEHERQQQEATMNEGEGQQGDAITLEGVLYTLMQSYVLQKLKAKFDLQWDRVKDKPKEREDFFDKKKKIAKDAFLAVRSRTADADFVDYFAGTLFSVHQSLSKERFALVTRALRDEPRRVRTLTLLALSAVS